jgi:hypothetical protein
MFGYDLRMPKKQQEANGNRGPLTSIPRPLDLGRITKLSANDLALAFWISLCLPHPIPNSFIAWSRVCAKNP